jgi:hypothetical protein
MARWHNIFKDKNEWNEKTIVGFISFALMVIYAFTFLISSILGYTMELNEVIFNGLLTVTLGSFGIAEVSKTAESWKGGGRYHRYRPRERERDIEDNPDEKDDYLDTE